MKKRRRMIGRTQPKRDCAVCRSGQFQCKLYDDKPFTEIRFYDDNMCKIAKNSLNLHDHFCVIFANHVIGNVCLNRFSIMNDLIARWPSQANFEISYPM